MILLFQNPVQSVTDSLGNFFDVVVSGIGTIVDFIGMILDDVLFLIDLATHAVGIATEATFYLWTPLSVCLTAVAALGLVKIVLGAVV